MEQKRASESLINAMKKRRVLSARHTPALFSPWSCPPPAPPPPPPAKLSDPVRIYKTFRPSEVMMVKMQLEGEGIPFVTGNEYFGSLYPSADGMASVEILVDRSDVERARRALAPLLKGAVHGP